MSTPVSPRPSLAPPLLITKPFNVALIQLGGTSSDKSANLSHCASLLSSTLSTAKQRGEKLDMVVLPECWNSPYGVQHFAEYAEVIGEEVYDAVKSPLELGATTISPDEDDAAVVLAALEKRWGVDGKDGRGVEVDEDRCKSETVRLMSSWAREHSVVLVGGSIPEREEGSGRLFNTATVFDERGRLISMHRKLHLFDIDIPGKMTFQESKTLTAGDRVTVFDCCRFGLGICYDMRFPEMAQIASRLGAGAMIYPGAFNTTTGPRHWELLQRSRANDSQMYVVACSPARPSEEAMQKDKAYPSWGHSTVVDAWAQVVVTTEEVEDVVYARIDPDVVKEARAGVPISRQRRFDVYADVAHV